MKTCHLDKVYTDSGSKKLEIVCENEEYPRYQRMDDALPKGINYCVFCGKELKDET